MLAVLFHLSTQAAAWQKTYTFQELEKRTLVENYESRALQARLTALSHERSAETAHLWPRFSSFYRYDTDDFSFLDEGVASQQSLTLRFSQDLIGLFSARSNRQGNLQAKQDLVSLQLQASQRSSLLSFRRQYVRILADRARVAHYEQMFAAHERLYDLRKARYEHQEDLLTEVLEAEKELTEVRGLLDYHRSRLAMQQRLLVEQFGLTVSDVAWNEIPVRTPTLDRNKLLAAAVTQNESITALAARTNTAGTQSHGLRYEDLRLEPFVGFRWRRGQFNTVERGPEVGIRFSMSLGLPKKQSQLNQKQRAEQTALQLESEQAILDVKQALSLALDEHSLLKTRRSTLEKQVELNKERIRIERSMLQQSVSSLRADPANLLKLEAQTVELDLQIQLNSYEQLKAYYEILFLAGLTSEPEMQPFVARRPVASEDVYPTALWLWQPQRLLLNEREKQQFIEFCLSKKISEVFISINSSVLTTLRQVAAVQTFLGELHQAKINVAALFGEPKWIYEEHRKNLTAKTRALLNYNVMALPTAQFDAIHLDIEPHTLPEWQDQPTELFTKLTETVRAVKNVIDELQPGIELQIDIPPYYAKLGRAALTTLIETVDSVTIMAYERKEADKVLRASREIITLCQAANKKCVLGLNANDFENERELRTLITTLGPQVSKIIRTPSFAIHDYQRYQDLTKR